MQINWMQIVCAVTQSRLLFPFRDCPQCFRISQKPFLHVRIHSVKLRNQPAYTCIRIDCNPLLRVSAVSLSLYTGQQPLRRHIQHLTYDHDLLCCRICLLLSPVAYCRLRNSCLLRKFFLCHIQLIQLLKYPVPDIHTDNLATCPCINTIIRILSLASPVVNDLLMHALTTNWRNISAIFH